MTKDLKVLIPIHQAKEVGLNLNTCRGLLNKCPLDPTYKKALRSLLTDSIKKLQASVKLAEKGV